MGGKSQVVQTSFFPDPDLFEAACRVTALSPPPGTAPDAPHLME